MDYTYIARCTPKGDQRKLKKTCGKVAVLYKIVESIKI